MCVDTAKIVFVTKNRYTGNLGGATGANAKCQAEAVETGLKGAFKAWTEKPVQDPYQTFVKSSVPYILIDGSVIADDWEDLVDGHCQSNLDIDLSADGSDPTCSSCPYYDIGWALVHSDAQFLPDEGYGNPKGSGLHS